jgi:hypothetical protein
MPNPLVRPSAFSTAMGSTLRFSPPAEWWRFKYRFHGKEKPLSLGLYPAVPSDPTLKQRLLKGSFWHSDFYVGTADELIAAALVPGLDLFPGKPGQPKTSCNYDSTWTLTRKWPSGVYKLAKHTTRKFDLRVTCSEEEATNCQAGVAHRAPRGSGGSRYVVPKFDPICIFGFRRWIAERSPTYLPLT